MDPDGNEGKIHLAIFDVFGRLPWRKGNIYNEQAVPQWRSLFLYLRVSPHDQGLLPNVRDLPASPVRIQTCYSTSVRSGFSAVADDGSPEPVFLGDAYPAKSWG